MQARVRVYLDTRPTTPLHVIPLELVGTLRDPRLGYTVTSVRQGAESMRLKARTDNKPLVAEVLQIHGVRLGNDEHALDALTRPLLAEHHLEDGVVDGLASDLPTEQVQLPVGDFEVRSGVFVLRQDMSMRSASK